MEKILDSIYFNPKNTASFGGYRRLFIKAKEKSPIIKIEDIKKYLRKQDCYTLYKPKRHKFLRNKTIAYGVDNIWQSDISDMQKYAEYNDGFRYILFIIDVYSRYLFMEPLKTKKSENVADALYKVMIENNRFPGIISTDSGKEYLGKSFQEMLKNFNIDFFTHHSVHKASIAERSQRTIKEKMFRYFSKFNTYRYIDVLKNFEIGYNNAYHRGIKSIPSESVKNKKIIEINLKAKKKARYKKDTPVRISRVAHFTRKGFSQGWSDEIFIIDKVLENKGDLPMYILKDIQNEIIKGGFYEEELQEVSFDNKKQYIIEKIIGEKRVGRNLLYLVKWKGWPEKYSSYINSKSIKMI